ncbi:MAG: hypothetical protein VX252_17255 [Myxococcota bacterium]|nr:hypothetical protein [Myxococcota bacterium]
MIKLNNTTENNNRNRSLRNRVSAAFVAIASLALLTSSAGAQIFEPIELISFNSDVGDLVTFSPQTKAQSAEVNQNFSDIKDSLNAKTAGGIDYYAEDDDLVIEGGPVSVASVEVTIPYTGYVKLDFSGYVRSSKVDGANRVRCALKTSVSPVDSDEDRLVGSRRYWDSRNQEPEGAVGSYFTTMDTQGIYFSVLPGTVTFHAVCQSDDPTTFRYRSLIATFHEDRL